jgi:hypothetical protein
MKTKLIITALIVLVPVIGIASYILGSIRAEKRASELWKAHFIPTELAAAKAIREGDTSKAKKILDMNALFYDRSFDIPTSFLPSRWDLDYFFRPEPYDLGTVGGRVSKAREFARDYVAAYPDSILALNK